MGDQIHSSRYYRRTARTAPRATITALREGLTQRQIQLDDSLLRQLERLGDSRIVDAVHLLASQRTIPEETLWRIVADIHGLAFINLDWIRIDRQLMTAISIDTCLQRRFIPLRHIEGMLEVAVADPTDRSLAMELRQALQQEVVLLLSIPTQLDRYLAIMAVDQQSVTDDLARLDELDLAHEARWAADNISERLAGLMVRLVHLAAQQQASDIHLECLADAGRIRLRIDGHLRELSTTPTSVTVAAITWAKAGAGMDVTEHRLPQDGRLSVPAGTSSIDIRVSTVPTIHGEKMVLRLMDQRRISLDLSELQFSPRIQRGWEHLLQQPHGLLLVTGPTGSGKTTTLYASLARLAGPEVNVTTVEDPVEYRLGGINQVQVNTKAGLTFAKVLRSVLRQDPDVILVGEIRDRETAEVAVQAGLTGHLVLGTLHANTPADAIIRLNDLGVPSFLLGQTLRGVLSQRLVRRLCSECRQPVDTDAVRRALPQVGSDIIGHDAKGCPTCHGTGYRGRLPLHELLPIDERTGQAISAGATPESWLPIAHQTGWRPLLHDGLVKTAAGLTSLAEVRALTTLEGLS